jgi:diaminopimelate epimerase
MATPFYKMTGSGNDFVFVDGRDSALADWPARRIAAVCDRRNGVGADGLVLLEALEPGSIRMHYFNSDGGRAALCGNASLCSARLAARLGLAPSSGMELLTDAGSLRVRCVGDGHMAELRFPSFPVPAEVELEWGPGESGKGWLGDVGVPHLIVLVEDIGAVDVHGRGRALRYSPQFGPQGTNVNFVAREDGPEGMVWRIRTYERGVEGETLACGTGTVCAAIALAGAGLSDLPVRITTGSGAVLSVAGQVVAGRSEEVWLCGEGRLVFRGELDDL